MTITNEQKKLMSYGLGECPVCKKNGYQGATYDLEWDYSIEPPKITKMQCRRCGHYEKGQA